jgi:hypothetical protein
MRVNGKDEYDDRHDRMRNIKGRIKDTSLAKAVGNEVAAELLLKYHDYLKENVNLLLKHVADKDMMGVRNIAHSLKGSGKSYGLGFVTQIGVLLSSSAKKENISEIMELIEKLDKWVRDSFLENIT